MLKARRDQINWLADSVRESCELSTPVDVEKAVQRLSGSVVIANDLEYEAKVEKAEAGFRISLKSGAAKSRRRFTIAHELGHLFLHMGYLVDPATWDSVSDYADSVYYRFGYSTEEYEANEFAAAFLMPRSEFVKVARSHLIGGRYPLQAIAGHFEVSVDAAKNRGRWLGLFSWD